MWKRCKIFDNKKWLAIIVILLIITVFFIFILNLLTHQRHYKAYLSYFESNVSSRIFKRAAVATDSPICAQYGKEMLIKNGSAMDALLSTLLCMGVVLPHSMGIGGGVNILYYDRTTKKVTVFDGRETAPLAATEDLFKNEFESRYGPKSIAVPGELKAYKAAHDEFGLLSWKTLFEGAINVSFLGFEVSYHLKNAITNLAPDEANFIKELIINPKTGKVFQYGEKMYRKTYGETLRNISLFGVDDFYFGETGKKLLNDLKSKNSILTHEDLKLYRTKTYKAQAFNLTDNYTFFSTNAPGGGLILNFILQVMLKLNGNKMMIDSFKSAITYYHRMVEIFKYAYQIRSQLEDPDFGRVNPILQNITSEFFYQYIASLIEDNQTFEESHYGKVFSIIEDQGTAHVTVVDEQGNVAAATSTINSYFGSKIYSLSTGIVLNNQMDDFSSNFYNNYDVAPSVLNRIEVGKRPLSSTCPSIIVNSKTNELVLSLGAAGGTKITTALAQVIYRYLFLKDSIKISIDAPRLHHQLHPNVIVLDEGFPINLINGLTNLGHTLKRNTARFSVVLGIVKNKERNLEAMYDYRKGGSVDGY